MVRHAAAGIVVVTTSAGPGGEGRMVDMGNGVLGAHRVVGVGHRPDGRT